MATHSGEFEVLWSLQARLDGLCWTTVCTRIDGIALRFFTKMSRKTHYSIRLVGYCENQTLRSMRSGIPVEIDAMS